MAEITLSGFRGKFFLPSQLFADAMGFAEAAAAKHGETVDRKNWRVLLSWHIAETREKARAEAREGLVRHHDQYIAGTLQRPDAKAFKDPDEAVDKAALSDGASATIGTPDDWWHGSSLCSKSVAASAPSSALCTTGPIRKI
jgi:alkanesulfonate monooxygenase SsuD/methylene tetrahydromethanopterin reductase-like flavin-dependent oxidoreductase (luciferase family)